MKSHRVNPVVFLVSWIFCSSLNAQTDQPVAVQVSGLLNWTDTNQRWESGVEGQMRWSRGAWSFGVGVQYTSREGLNNPHLGRNAIGCGSKIRFEDLSER